MSRANPSCRRSDSTADTLPKFPRREAQAGAHPSIEPAGQPDSRQSSGPLPSGTEPFGRLSTRNRARFPAVPPGSARSLPRHEIPSKDGVAVPPGPARSLRGQCPILWQGSFDSSRDSRHRSAFATGWPGIAVPPGSARSLPQHRIFFRFPVAPWVFDLELSTLLGESRPGHYLFRTVNS